MPIINRIADFHEEMTEWRREMHAHPETAFEEVWTSDFIAKRLEEIGVDHMERGLAKTGIVATIKGNGGPGGRIGIRADFDALDIIEATGKPWASKIPGKMHGCGHDGHTAILLGAARYLAETRNFSGEVVLIFQPAEENVAGGRVMVEDDGLFEKYPVDAVYGMHNRPGLPVGKICMRPGPSMAGADMFEIFIHGYGGHAARPHKTIDPIIVQAQIVLALQSIVSRSTDPLDSAVLSVTQVSGGHTGNVVPDLVYMQGTVRTFRPEVQDMVEAKMKKICTAIAEGFDCTIEVKYDRRYPALVNDPVHIEKAAAIARELVGDENVDTDAEPVMGAEDFAYMLQHRPGCYINLGNGIGDDGGVNVHNPAYDFNDEALPYGASYWALLVEKLLPKAA
ncbi:M20 aminoacylase family protein [Thalassobaculum sp.]|uniref:M20 aminoacylase family protein n=1 Tax=Thalassobaculum sp. TaxID=2022740 RepID=UPI003B592E88